MDRLLRLLAGVSLALLLELIPLPALIAPLRPMGLPLILAHAALHESDLPVLLAAFLSGLASDLLLDTPLGQQALALVALVYLLLRLRVSLGVLPVWQVSLVLVPVWALYAFLQFWIDGVARHPADPWLRWMPVASTALCWPALVWLLDLPVLRRRRRTPLL
jgi:rod shape-determining protein MreD